MTRNEDLSPKDKAFIQTLMFSMEKILFDTIRDELQISSMRYGRIINGIKNGSRETLTFHDIRVYTYHLELIRRNWPMSSGWVCNEISGGTHLVLEFRRKRD